MPKNFLENDYKGGAQPVRFYKFIALSFLFITVVLLGVIVFMSSKRANIIITTKSDAVEANFPAKVAVSGQGQVEGIVTSKLIEKTRQFNPEGSRQEPGVATGKVTIYNDTSSDQPLIATTRLLTSDEVLFRIKNRVNVPAGGSVEAEVYADKEGGLGDIGPSEFIIPGLNTNLQKEIYAKSSEPMTGGIKKIGVLNEGDITKAEKVILEEIEKESANDFSTDYPGWEVLTKVIQYDFSKDKELGEEASDFTLDGQATVLAVIYNPKDLNEYAYEMLEKQVVDNSEELKSVEDKPIVTLDNYNLDDKTAILNVAYNGRVNIDSNSQELQRSVFFGKSEDEVRRYIMSLDHVQSVEMEFKPVWNRTVPHVADHVNITIREVE